MQRRSQNLLPFSGIYTSFALLFSTIFHSAYGVPSMTLVTVLDPQHPITVAPLPSSLSIKRKDESETGGFWLTTDLLEAEFRKGCLSTALCHEPRFRLINTMTVNGEQSVISWPANSGGDLVQDHARAFVTHWTEGDPEDVALSCQVAGTDPSFGFARVCDETPSKRVFNEAAIQRTLAGSELQSVGGGVGGTVTRRLERRGTASASGRVTRNEDRMIVELRGRCFNATLAVRKHLTRCPWCPDPNVQIAVGDAASAAAASVSDEKNGASTLFQRRISAGDSLLVHNLVIVALSGAVVFAFTGLCCAIGFHCHYRRRHRRKGSATTASATGVGGIIIGSGGSGKKRLLKFAPSPSEVYKQQQMENYKQHNQQHQQQQYGANLRENQKYETPWDNAVNNNNKYRPLPHQQWMIDAEFLEEASTMPSSEMSAAHHHHQQQQHYQTLTMTRGVGGGMAFPSAPPPPPPPPPLYGVEPPKPKHGTQTQVSGSSLAATGSARSSGGSGSTSATTLGSVGSSAGAIITVSPTVNSTNFGTLSRQSSNTCCGAPPPVLPPNPYFTHHPHPQQLHLQPLPLQRNGQGTTASLARRFHNNNNNKPFHDDSGLDSV